MARANRDRTGRRNRGWILIPIALVFFGLIALLISNFQQETGLARPSNSGRAAVAAAARVDRALSAGTTYEEFGATLRVALVAHRNMVINNPTDVRLEHLVHSILDCYTAAREAWQAELVGAWAADTYGDPRYWRALHPALVVPGEASLTAGDVKEACRAQAVEILAEAIDKAE